MQIVLLHIVECVTVNVAVCVLQLLPSAECGSVSVGVTAVS